MIDSNTRPPTEVERELIRTLDDFADTFVTLIVERVVKKLNLEEHLVEVVPLDDNDIEVTETSAEETANRQNQHC